MVWDDWQGCQGLGWLLGLGLGLGLGHDCQGWHGLGWPGYGLG